MIHHICKHAKLGVSEGMLPAGKFLKIDTLKLHLETIYLQILYLLFVNIKNIILVSYLCYSQVPLLANFTFMILHKKF